MVVEENEGLVKDIVLQCLNKINLKIEFDDAFQEGRIGLLKAYQRFDGRGAFSTFAFYWIRLEIMTFIRDKAPAIRIPGHLYELTGKIIKQRLIEEKPDTIAEKLNCTIEAATFAIHYLENPKPGSLNFKLTSDGVVELVDLTGTEDDFSSIIVREFMELLNYKQRKALTCKMIGFKQREIATLLGVTRGALWFFMEETRAKARSYFELTSEAV
ncbi:sigma-70 family RNA polymerase sigma factor [Paenibacillus glucanolyticus]|uniref:sigma-70 family RNA polymerase sigma factor n=1 Tax=Paenibacillus glucanolyticus TaxID=59843 RepID=UPI0015C30357|nr:sigma-70 family RNA polymerase sigma factor [Paenibacillus glucanolyticus]